MDCSKWEVCLRTGTRGKHADSGRKSYYLRRCALNRGSPDCSDHSDLVLPWMLLLEAAPARSSVRWQPGAAAEPQAAQFSRRDREIIFSRNPFGGQIYQKWRLLTSSFALWSQVSHVFVCYNRDFVHTDEMHCAPHGRAASSCVRRLNREAPDMLQCYNPLLLIACN